MSDDNKSEQINQWDSASAYKPLAVSIGFAIIVLLIGRYWGGALLLYVYYFVSLIVSVNAGMKFVDYFNSRGFGYNITILSGWIVGITLFIALFMAMHQMAIEHFHSLRVVEE